jgi:membrane fusion protein (multidrug efflux system)
VRVKLGVRRDAMVELLEGVKAGDLVVTAGMRVSRDGQPVRVVNAAAAAAAAEAKAAAAATK